MSNPAPATQTSEPPVPLCLHPPRPSPVPPPPPPKLQVARAILILVCWLPFNYTGYPLTWRSALVIMWGGLRGAVGMIMSLFIFLDTKIYDASFKSYCIFYMGTIAFFTGMWGGGEEEAGA